MASSTIITQTPGCVHAVHDYYSLEAERKREEPAASVTDPKLGTVPTTEFTEKYFDWGPSNYITGGTRT